MVSNPLNSDMDWEVRFDKEDFIGRGALAMTKERGLRNKLVGFVMRDGLVPDDGDPVVAGRAPVGRVTSSRLSPTLGKGFGFAWVPIELAKEGEVIYIRVDGRTPPCSGHLGSRLRPRRRAVARVAMPTLTPIALSAMHHRQVALDRRHAGKADGWQRPARYGRVEVEVKRVRSSVGLHDVSPVGKLILHGEDITSLLQAAAARRGHAGYREGGAPSANGRVLGPWT